MRDSSPSQFWTYEYIDDPGWHHDDDPVADTPFRVYNTEIDTADLDGDSDTTELLPWWREKDITLWSDWRGFDAVKVTVGAVGDTQPSPSAGLRHANVLDRQRWNTQDDLRHPSAG